MQKLSREDLYSLERYHAVRDDFRRQVMAHKKPRQLPLGPNVTLYFEDRLTIQYQIQEMLRVERIFEAEAIDEELDAYNPLVPDGTNLKATMMIEYEDRAERTERLRNLVGIETAVWMQAGEYDRVFPFADEDMERATGQKTSAVHFLRFEFDSGMITAIKAGANISAGIDHPVYSCTLASLPEQTRESLVRDFN